MPDTAKPIRVGIIGCGERGIYVLGMRAVELYQETGIEIRVLCDINSTRVDEARFFLELQYQEAGIFVNIDTETDYRQVVNRSDIDCVFITNYTSQHRDPTVAALEARKRVYLDKPIATTLKDAKDIMKAEEKAGLPIIMGFTRRYEHSWQRAVALLQEGKIGVLQTVLLRSVIPYARYFQRWHRCNDLSGGALNDKVSHYFDALNWIVQASSQLACSPATVSAFGGRSQVFAASEESPSFCRECDRVCPFRALPSKKVKEPGIIYTLEPDYQKVIKQTGTLPHFELPSWHDNVSADARIDNCVYRPDSDIIDHANILVQYRNGVQASIFWCIFGPPSPDQETLELVGSSGRLRLTRHTGEIDLITNYGQNRETIDARGPDFTSSHFGADLKLLREIRRQFDDSIPIAGTRDAYESLRLVIASQQAINAGGGTVVL